jgi:plasmid stabilization system protein ParE
MRWEIHPEALLEYQEAALYYEVRDASLAHRFVEAIEDAIRRIVESPLSWRVVDDDVRRCLTRHFPYAVLYTVDGDDILIVAIMHGHREPGYWRGRVGQE